MKGIPPAGGAGTRHDQPPCRALLVDGAQWGLSLAYAVQPCPEGLAQAFHIGTSFVGRDSVARALGDHRSFGRGVLGILRRAAARESGPPPSATRCATPSATGSWRSTPTAAP